jgi:putative ABC transport system permease protein
LRVALPPAKYSEDRHVVSFFEQLLQRVSTLPGVTSAALVSTRPMHERATADVTVEGSMLNQPGSATNAEMRIISPEYPAVMGIPLVRGRTFGTQDIGGALPTAMINETMAARFWPGLDPIGRRFRMAHETTDMGASGTSDEQPAWLTVVGVLRDTRQSPNPLRQARQEFYVALAQTGRNARDLAVMVRTAVDPATLAEPIRLQVETLDPEQPVYWVETLESLVAAAHGPQRLAATLLGVFAAIAIGLCALGLYAVVSYTVSQRTREIGIRIALGALPWDILRVVLSEAATMTALGLAAGMVAAFIVMRTIRGLLYGVNPADPVVIVGVSMFLAAVALVASYVPSRRAAAVDPTVSLRNI